VCEYGARKEYVGTGGIAELIYLLKHGKDLCFVCLYVLYLSTEACMFFI
jgi:hypothetical protein